MKVNNTVIRLVAMLIFASIAGFIGYNMMPNNAEQYLTKINIICILFAAPCQGYIVGIIGVKITNWILSKINNVVRYC